MPDTAPSDPRPDPDPRPEPGPRPERRRASGAAGVPSARRAASAGGEPVTGRPRGRSAAAPDRGAGRKAPVPRPEPTRAVEDELRTAGARVVAGIDEVGRGAWAGPVVVAAVVPGDGPVPAGLTDSKLLTARRREAIEAALRPWAVAYGIGAADPHEIDDLGMTAALRLAAERALAVLPVRPDAVVLDGKHDYLGEPWTVRCVVKGDISCVSVAAASVIAKVHRDALMARLGADTPAYAFADNAGYPSPVHRAALAEHGPTPHHRMSWAYWDALPAWRHLRRPRIAPEDEGQMALDL